jgi:hypothetical protein
MKQSSTAKNELKAIFEELPKQGYTKKASDAIYEWYNK